jgi:iron-sulfur cluster protein
MPVPDYKNIHPREVADKAAGDNLYRAINMALEVETDALRLNTQSFNENRYKAVARLNNYEILKRQARKIKEDSIKKLPALITTLKASIEGRGGKVYIARTKQEASGYIKNVCKEHHARLVVKSKSITSEEIGLNKALEADNIEVAETDLAEFILQVSGEQPSHIVAPAIHRSRERISELFRKNFKTELPLETGEQLTIFARDILRKKFLSADVGITGANLISADEGAILLVESEGNITLTTQLPAVHIAVAGIEKIIESRKNFGTFIELLAASGTGQPLTSYTNILEPPFNSPVLNLNDRKDEKREFHLVLVDNGRMKMREDNDLREALYCIRCSACMNVCVNFQAVGGHAFGGECYTGGIGGAWTAGTSGDIHKARFAELCSGCTRCIPNCPVMINIPRLNTVIKSRLIKEKTFVFLQKMFFGHFAITGKITSVFPKTANLFTRMKPVKHIVEITAGFDRRRGIPRIPGKTLQKLYREYRQNNVVALNQKVDAALFADIYTNYNNPEAGLSLIKVFDRLRLPVTLTKTISEGRAAQSQGMTGLARTEAEKTAAYLAEITDSGKDIIVAEPSVLSMFKYDYRDLLKNDYLFGKIFSKVFDPFEYLMKLYEEKILSMEDITGKITLRAPLFCHEHCQGKLVNKKSYVKEFYEMLDFTVKMSTAECCGMAGSFGYKKQYYELSKSIGKELTKQIDNGMIILASGTSCREQIADELKRKIYHPAEYLEQLLK